LFNKLGKALIGLGGCLIGSFDTSKTSNKFYFINKQTDIRREGLMSKGKQPRLQAKVPKK